MGPILDALDIFLAVSQTVDKSVSTDKFDSELEETRCVVDEDGGRHDGHLLAHSAHRAQARRLTPTYRGHFGLRLGPSFDLQGRGKSTSVPLGPVQHI